MNKLLIFLLIVCTFITIVLIAWVSYPYFPIISSRSEVNAYTLKLDKEFLKKYALEKEVNTKFLVITLTNQKQDGYPLIYKERDGEGETYSSYGFSIDRNKITIYIHYNQKYLDKITTNDQFNQFDQPSFLTLLAINHIAHSQSNDMIFEPFKVVGAIQNELKSTKYPVLIQKVK